MIDYLSVHSMSFTIWEDFCAPIYTARYVELCKSVRFVHLNEDESLKHDYVCLILVEREPPDSALLHVVLIESD